MFLASLITLYSKLAADPVVTQAQTTRPTTMRAVVSSRRPVTPPVKERPLPPRLKLPRTGTVVKGIKFDDVRDAIHQIESERGKYLYGDYSKVTGKPGAYGHYHMHESYALDAGLNPKTWKKDVMHEPTARAAMKRYVRRYMRQYLPKDLDNDDMSPEAVQTMIRMHNGGPYALHATGEKRDKLDAYYNKVIKIVYGKYRLRQHQLQQNNNVR